MGGFLNWPWLRNARKTLPPPLLRLQSADTPHVSVTVRERSVVLRGAYDDSQQRTGSACVLDRHTLLTAYHVMEDMPAHAFYASGLLTRAMPGQHARVGRLLLADKGDDIALVELLDPLPYDIPYLPIHDKVGLVGDQLHAFSTQRELELDLRLTSIARYNVASHQISLPGKFIGGDSGSGLFGPDGRLYGIVTHLLGATMVDRRTGTTVMLNPSNLATYAPSIRDLLQQARWPGLPLP